MAKDMLPKMTRAMWLDRLDDAIEESKPWRDRALRYRRYYENKPTSPSKTPQVVVNTLYKEIKSSLPAIFAKNPDVLCRAKTPTEMSKALAHYANGLLPYYMSELRLKRTINRVLLDAKIFGMGVMKFGWSFEVVEQALSDEVFQGLAEDRKSHILELASNQARKDGQAIVEDVIRVNEPWVLRWDATDVIIDPEASSPDLSDARWIAFRKLIDYSEARQYGFKGLEKIDYKVKATRQKKKDQPDYHRCTLYEIHDKLRKETRLILEEAEQEQTIPWDVAVDGFLAETIFFNEVPNDPYGHPTVRFYEDQLIEKNDIRTHEAEQRRAFNAQVLVEKDALSREELSKMVKNVPNTVITLNPGGLQKIGVRPTPPIPPALFQTQADVDRDIAEQIGSEVQRGTQTQVEQTATQSAIIEARQKTRQSEQQDAVEELLRRTLVKLWMLLRQKLPRPRVEEILGESAPFWINVEPEEAIKELDIDIRSNSTLPRLDRQILIAQDLQLLTLLSQYAPILQTQGQMVDITPLMSEILDLMNHRTTASQIIKGVPMAPMMMEQMMGGMKSGMKKNGSASTGTPAAVASPANLAERLGAEHPL